MKFDTVIIGGGLAGLTCGIRLQQKGKKCAIISSGQSALHFSSGSFDLLNRLPDGTEVTSPIHAVEKLDKEHPYVKLGDKFSSYASEAKRFLEYCGVEVHGEAERNHLRITPMGKLKPTWLTISDFLSSAFSIENIAEKKILLVNLDGFLDFNTRFIADSLERRNAKCHIVSINTPALERLRISPTEMRSTNIARALDDELNFEILVDKLQRKADGFDILALPAVLGLSSDDLVKRLKERLSIPLWLIPTMPPSVPGIRIQQQMHSYFEKLGGVYMLGDTVTQAKFEHNKVKSVSSINHGDIPFYAENFILASGSYFSNGLVAHPHQVIEPVFSSDIDFAPEREDWYDKSFLGKQNYMRFGVMTDDCFRIKIKGNVQQNLFAVGSILSGFNALYEGCGAGVSMLSALYVADNL